MKNIDILSGLLKNYVTGKVVGIYVYEILKRKNYKNLSAAIEENPQIVDDILWELIETRKSIHSDLLKNKKLPSNIIQKIANNAGNSYNLSLIVKHNNCPFELLEEIALNNSNSGIRTVARKALARYPNISLKILQEFTLDTNYSVRISAREAIAKHPDTSLEELEKLAFDAEPKVKRAVALRPDLPIDLIKKMAADRQIIAKKFLLRNKSFSKSLLTTLSESSEPKVLQMVALHPNTPIDLLEKLAKISSAKSFVAQNPNVTIEILEDLSESDNQEIQLAVVKNHKSTFEILTKLASRSKDYKILIPIVENNNTPERVKSTILEGLSVISKLEIRKYVANNRSTPQNILLKWAKSHKFYKLHHLIAKNSNTPVMALDIIAKKFCSKKVFKNLIKNTNTSGEILEFLYKNKKYLDTYFYSRTSTNMKNHPNIPKYIKADIIKYSLNILELAKKSDIYVDVLLRKLRYDDTYDYYLLRDYDLPISVINYIAERLSKSHHVLEREFLAFYPKTPTHILYKLAKDRDVNVQYAAQYSLEQRNL